MSPKRSPAAAELLPLCTTRLGAKRARLSPPAADDKSDASAPTTAPVSEVSALRSSPASGEDTGQSSVDSASEDESEEDEEDEDSVDEGESDSSGSSSALWEETDAEEDEREEREEREDIVALGGPRKPRIDPRSVMEEADKLYERLQDVLPRIKAANLDLFKKNAVERSMEDVEEGEGYIEMNLGLGVLKEKRGGGGEEEDSEEDDDEEEPDVMRDLLGRKESGLKVGIQELAETSTVNKPDNNAAR